jgi:hypothetical protein
VTYFPDKTANDWNEPHSIWRIALNMGMGERPPDRILHWETPYSAEMRALWPYLDEYSTAYLLRFPEPVPPSFQATPLPAPTGATSFTPVEASLVIAGAIGTMRFHWRLDGGSELPSEGRSGPSEKPAESPKP